LARVKHLGEREIKRFVHHLGARKEKDSHDLEAVLEGLFERSPTPERPGLNGANGERGRVPPNQKEGQRTRGFLVPMTTSETSCFEHGEDRNHVSQPRSWKKTVQRRSKPAGGDAKRTILNLTLGQRDPRGPRPARHILLLRTMAEAAGQRWLGKRKRRKSPANRYKEEPRSSSLPIAANSAN